MDYLIELENVTLLSEDFMILKDVTISFPVGKCTLILGPSGCGKSTLLKAAAGILIPDWGRVLIEGKNLIRMSEKELQSFRKKNGFVFQDAALWANRSLFENLAIPLQFHFPDLSRKEIHERVMKSLEETGMDSQAFLRPAQISAGEQKIVSLQRALILDPIVLYMDEPTLSIDKKVVGIIYDIIRNYKQKNRTLLVVTHDQDLISWLADYLVILVQGKIVEAGPFDTVKNSTDPDVQSVLSSVLAKAASYDTDILGLLDREEIDE